MTYQKDVGAWGEAIACAYLKSQGYKIIDHNFHTRYGEIDIICSMEKRLIFFEVKTRTSTSYGFPEDSISEYKRQHLLDAAILYLEDHSEFEEWEFDLITVEGKYLSKKPSIMHFRNAIVE